MTIALAIADTKAGLHTLSAMRAAQRAEHISENAGKAFRRVDDAADNIPDDLAVVLVVGAVDYVRDPDVLAEVLDRQRSRDENLRRGNGFADADAGRLAERTHGGPHLARVLVVFAALLRRYAAAPCRDKTPFLHGPVYQIVHCVARPSEAVA